MKNAEDVTFGGSGLERAAHLRGNAAALADLKTSELTHVVVFWRGKPLIARRPVEDGGDYLQRVPVTHCGVAPYMREALFLGSEADGAIFAVDLADWDPDALDAAAMSAFLDPTEQHHPEFAPTNVFAELRANMTRLCPRDAELAATARALFMWHGSHGFCAKCGAASDVSMAGWQRDCPSCGAHHFPRTDPVVIMLITHGNSVLMGRSPGWPEGMYSLLAGFVEPGETLEAAVRREVFEEAGVRVGEVGYLASQPWPFPASLMMGCYGLATSQDIKIDPIEIEDACWVSREEMMQVFAGEHATIKPARRGAIAHFLLERWLSDRLG